MEPRKYYYNNSTLTIIFGNILESKAEVIVSSDDTGVSMSGGVSGSIRKAGGEAIRIDAQKKLPAQVGDVVVSTSGDLPYQKFIFHCLTIDFDQKYEVFSGALSNTEDINNYILQHSVDKCFRLLQALDLKSIAFPCIGAGLANIPLKKVAEIMADAISSNLSKTQKPYEVELYLFNQKGFDDDTKTMTEIDYIDMFENFAIKAALYRYGVQAETKRMQTEPTHAATPIVDIPQREEMNHQVFISYSRKDIQSVEAIKNVLDDNGVTYWIDKEGIFSGENYKEVIVDAIETSQAVIFVSSANSNDSINVIRELGYSVKEGKTIIPILLDDTPYAKSIRLDIADIHQIEFSNTPHFEKELITSIAYAAKNY